MIFSGFSNANLTFSGFNFGANFDSKFNSNFAPKRKPELCDPTLFGFSMALFYQRFSRASSVFAKVGDFSRNSSENLMNLEEKI